MSNIVEYLEQLSNEIAEKKNETNNQNEKLSLMAINIKINDEIIKLLKS